MTTNATEEDDPIVGHKTMRRKDGSRYHLPLRKKEADAIWARIEAEEAECNEGLQHGTD